MMIVNCSPLPFLLLRKFFMNKYGLSFSRANFLSGDVYIISAIFCPIFGYFIGKTGHNLMWCKCIVL